MIIGMVACLCAYAGVYDLLWDYSASAPTENPDRGLQYGSAVNDAEGVKNGLKGIKLNSSGWCSFTKAAVPGVLKLTFAPRSGMNPASLQVHTWTGERMEDMTLIGETCEQRALATQLIPLTAEQNKIFITRLTNMETVLQKIEFVAGETYTPKPCEPVAEEELPALPEVRTDTLSANALFFIRALADANKNGHKTIYLPNGVYDLGGLTLTAIEANGIAIIGESMEGVVIRNTPDYRVESIDKSATLRIAPNVEKTYLQNLTIQNALDYYANNNGRAVALWDQGTKTVCKNVRLLSYQDTYYSDHVGALKYFEDCEIHGTVDFICGDGNVYFKNCLLYCEKRSADGSGTDALTASGAAEGDQGYVFERCTVKSECPVVSLGRSWKNSPRCVFLHTTLDMSAGPFGLENKAIKRWTVQGMSVLPECFGEYQTTDTDGHLISPATNEVDFVFRGRTKTMNTILTKEQAEAYTMENVLGPWAEEAKQQIQIHLTN